MKRLWNEDRKKMSRNKSTRKIRSRLRKLLFESLDERIPLAVDAQIIKDINALPTLRGSSPRSFTEVGNTIFFTAKTEATGEELWKTDSTTFGTVRVKDIAPGDTSSIQSFTTRKMENVNGILYFMATDGLSGYEIWRSDGTASGTYRVKDINSGIGSSNPDYLINVNGTLFFTAYDPTFGQELWKSDGTEVGTVRVKDIFNGSGSSTPQWFLNANGKLIFSAMDNSSGSELWTSDGTETGTYRIKDINPGGDSSSEVAKPILVNNTVFFVATDGLTGYELWKTDGSSDGTVLVKDIATGTQKDSFGTEMVNVNGTLFFCAFTSSTGYELWKSDGTGSGTVLVKDIFPGSTGSYVSYAINHNGLLLFAANNGTNGFELWRSDGSAGGTLQIKDIRSGGGSSSPSQLTIANGILYFAANDGTNGNELWKSDGTSNGTHRVKDINPGVGGSDPKNITNINGSIVFSANDGTAGTEVWISNGSDSGTDILRDIMDGTRNSGYMSYRADVNNTLFFLANDGINGYELWKSDGTASGTKLVKDIVPGSSGTITYSGNFLNNNGILFFTATDGVNGAELWRSDGTDSGTFMVKNIRAGSFGSRPFNLTNSNGTTFFVANDGSTGYELWKSDGTGSGTVRVKDIRSGVNGSGIRYTVNVNGILYFRANDGTSGYELWRSDGTESGTLRVKDIVVGSQGSSPQNLIGSNGVLFFTASDSSAGREIWKSDGTSSGTVRISDIRPGSFGSYPSYFANVSGGVFFRANDGTSGYELWRSDGTTTGTVRVKDIRAGSGSSDLQSLTISNGSLFFRANDGVNGSELWKSDGTETGTTAVKDIFSGAQGSSPSYLVNSNGKLFFAAFSERGKQLWFSDGTENGTQRLETLTGSSTGVLPMYLTTVNETLFYTAVDDRYGRELWRANLSDPNVPPTDIALSSSSLQENSGPNAAVGNFSTIDTNQGDSFTYNLVLGVGSTDNAAFNISGSILRANGSFNFEAKSSYSVRIRSTDQGGLYTEKAFTINVTDINEIPTDISLSSSSINENASANSTVGTLSTIDPDAVNTFTYSLVSGAGDSDNVTFNITGNTIRANSSLDFETKSSYSIRIRSTDQGGLYTEKAFTINVTNTNDAPVLNPDYTASMGSVLEGATNPSGISIADLLLDGSITDQDGIAIKAIAINRVNTTLGTWQFRQDGNSLWNTINSERVNSQTNELVLLLGPSAQLRMIPFGSLNGSIADGISYRAWDMTSGTQGTYNEVASVGGTTPFSLGSTLASIDVSAVNNAPTFRSGDGIVSTRIGANEDRARSVVVQPDGKILMGGYGTVAGSSFSDFALVRYNQDGSVDSTFGSGGKVITDFFGNRDVIYSVALQPDGKIVVGGLTTFNTNFIIVALARYNTDGSLDMSFGTGGKVTTGIQGQEACTSIMIRNDGKIVVAGFGLYSAAQGIIIQYNSDGSLDTGFGTGGMISFSQDSLFWGAVLQADGKVVAGGSVGNNFGAERYNADGSIDKSFGVNGKVSTDFNNSDDFGRAIAIQQDGKVVLVGLTVNSSGTSDIGIVRYNADGSLDTTFGQNGRVVSSPSNGSVEGSSIAIQRDGKILVTGIDRNSSQKAIFVSRFNTNGFLDSTFGANGTIRTALTNGSAIAQTISVQLDGKILVGGTAPSSSSNPDFGLVRYNPDGSLDTTFDLINTLGGTVNYVENSIAVVMDNNVKVMDAELRSSNYSGATLSLSRLGGANPQDAFIASGVVGSLNEGNDLVVTGVAIGTVTTNSNGILLLSFKSAASNDLVNTVLQSVAYENLSDSPPQSVQILWDFNDGNQGAQGLGGASSATGTVTINITSVNDNPNDISLTPNSIAENAGANATVGTFLTTDPDAGDTFTYTLVAGDGSTDNAAFNISGNALRANTSFNFETKSSYSVRIRSTDQGGLYTEKAFTINVTDVNETPTDISLSSSSITENAGANATVGTLSTTDPDALNTFSYSLVSGAGDTDNSAFNISGNTLRANNSFDFETKSSYSIRIRSTDQGGLYSEKAFTINVVNANELVSVSVNGADSYINASQRSQVTSLVVVTESVLSDPQTAFSLTNIGLLTASSTNLASSQILVTNVGNVYTIRFGAGAGVVTRSGTGARANSLADGNWILTVSNAQISGSNQFGNRAIDNFFRMFGDSDGDGDVDGLDAVALRRAQLAASYNAALDWDGNGSVSAGVDINNFSANVNKRRRSF